MKIKIQKYTAKYFKKTKNIIHTNKLKNKTKLQFTCFTDEYMVCGIKQIIDILKKNKVWKKIKFFSVKDGDVLKQGNAIIVIEGNYTDFCLYEGIIDGILARMSSIATNCWKMNRLIDSKKIIFMADRQDLFINHPWDGYAAYIGGIRTFVTESQTLFLNNFDDVKIVGTIPHALIQQFGGDINKTLKAYKDNFPNENLVALIDYHNDCLSEIEKIDKNLRKDLYAVRIDTSKNLIDKSLDKKSNNYGVCDNLIKLVRKKLDDLKMKNTKIIVSSSIDINWIQKMKNKELIDFYGVGSYFLRINLSFSGDLVETNGKHEAKYGRKLQKNKLQLQKGKIIW